MSLHSCSHRAGSLRGLCLRLQSQLRPPQPSEFPASPKGRGRMGKGRPRNLAEEMEQGWAFLTQSKGQMAPWAFSNPQTFPTTPFTLFRPPVQAEVAAHSHTQAHASPLAVVSQTKQQQETSMKFKREIAVTTAQHTCLPPFHTPFLPGREARQPQLKPRSQSCSRPSRCPWTCGAEKSSPGAAAGETSPCWGRAGGAAPGPVSRARPASCFGSVVADEDVQE